MIYVLYLLYLLLLTCFFFISLHKKQQASRSVRIQFIYISMHFLSPKTTYYTAHIDMAITPEHQNIFYNHLGILLIYIFSIAVLIVKKLGIV
jgi:hypothetical protein